VSPKIDGGLADIVYSEWEFFAHPDPTHGNVNFQTKEDAMRKKLAYVRKADNVLVLKVDDFSEVPVGGNRDSYVQFLFSIPSFSLTVCQRPHQQ